MCLISKDIEEALLVIKNKQLNYNKSVDKSIDKMSEKQWLYYFNNLGIAFIDNSNSGK